MAKVWAKQAVKYLEVNTDVLEKLRKALETSRPGKTIYNSTLYNEYVFKTIKNNNIDQQYDAASSKPIQPEDTKAYIVMRPVFDEKDGAPGGVNLSVSYLANGKRAEDKLMGKYKFGPKFFKNTAHEVDPLSEGIYGTGESGLYDDNEPEISPLHNSFTPLSKKRKGMLRRIVGQLQKFKPGTGKPKSKKQQVKQDAAPDLNAPTDNEPAYTAFSNPIYNIHEEQTYDPMPQATQANFSRTSMHQQQAPQYEDPQSINAPNIPEAQYMEMNPNTVGMQSKPQTLEEWLDTITSNDAFTEAVKKYKGFVSYAASDYIKEHAESIPEDVTQEAIIAHYNKKVAESKEHEKDRKKSSTPTSSKPPQHIKAEQSTGTSSLYQNITEAQSSIYDAPDGYTYTLDTEEESPYSNLTTPQPRNRQTTYDTFKSVAQQAIDEETKKTVEGIVAAAPGLKDFLQRIQSSPVTARRNASASRSRQGL